MDIIIGLAVAVLSLALLYVIICAVFGLHVMKTSLMPKRVPPEVTRQKDSDNGCPECFEDYEKRWERHSFELETYKALIKGEYIINPDSPAGRKKVAIICHGHTVSRWAALKYGRMFYQLGYNLIIFDERYFGQSEATNCTLGMHESHDVKRLIEYAREIFGADSFIALHGESMGAATSLLVLGLEKPDFVVADCPFADPYRLMRYLAKKQMPLLPPEHILFFARLFSVWFYGYDMHKVRPIDTAAQSDIPICLIHGLCDVYVPCEHSEMVAKVFRNPDSELHLVPGAGHARSCTIDKEGYVRILNAFVKKIEDKAL